MKEETLKQLIERRKEASLKLKKPFLSNWTTNLFYYLDQLQVTYSDELSKFQKEESIYVPYVPVNIAFAKYCNIEADILSLPMSFLCNALTGDIKDKMAAGVAEKTLNTVIAPKLKDKRKTLLFWMEWACRPLLKVYWSGKSGIPIVIPQVTNDPTEQDEPLYLMQKGQFLLNDRHEKVALRDKDNKPLYQKVKDGKPIQKIIMPGDVEFSVISPYEYFIDPKAKEEDSLYNPDNKAHWVMHQKLMSREEIEDKGWDTGGMVFDQSPISEFEKEYLTIEGLSVMPSDEYALYVEYYELPSGGRKKGRFAKLCGNKEIEDTDLPEPLLSLEQLPFIDFADSYVPFSWWTKSIIERIIPLQKAYSEESSLLLHLAKKCGRVRLITQGRIKGKVTITPVKNDELLHEVIQLPTAGNQQSQILMWDKIPMAILRHLDWILRDIQMVAGRHDISFPIKTQQLATEIMQTVEQDEKRMGKLLGILKDRFVRAGRLGLEIMKENYHKGREYTITNEFGESEIKAFNRTSFEGNYKIQIDLGQPLYMSRAATWSFTERLIQMGVVTNKDEAIQMLSLGENLETIENQVDYKLAQRENLDLMMQSEENRKDVEKPVKMKEVLEFHNHLIHIRVITKFLNQFYDSLTTMAVTAGIEHLAEHKEIMINSQIELQQKLQPLMQQQVGQQPQGEGSASTE